jgi:hypothetical protein
VPTVFHTGGVAAVRSHSRSRLLQRRDRRTNAEPISGGTARICPTAAPRPRRVVIGETAEIGDDVMRVSGLEQE